MSRPERSIVLSDIHFDDADERAVALTVRFMKNCLKPDVIWLDGDIIDNHALSRWPKHPARSRSFKQDVDRTRKFLQDLRADFPRTRIVFIGGNHDGFRLQKYIADQAPELYPFATLEKILGLEELGMEIVTSIHRENWIKYKDLYIGHYDKAAGNAASTAQSLIRERGVSVIQGHVHKVGMTAKTFLDRTLFAYENPCLASLDVDYVKSPNWQQGFTLVFANKKTTWVYPVVIKDYSFIWDSKEWIG